MVILAGALGSVVVVVASRVGLACFRRLLRAADDPARTATLLEEAVYVLATVTLANPAPPESSGAVGAGRSLAGWAGAISLSCLRGGPLGWAVEAGRLLAAEVHCLLAVAVVGAVAVLGRLHGLLDVAVGAGRLVGLLDVAVGAGLLAWQLGGLAGRRGGGGQLGRLAGRRGGGGQLGGLAGRRGGGGQLGGLAGRRGGGGQLARRGGVLGGWLDLSLARRRRGGRRRRTHGGVPCGAVSVPLKRVQDLRPLVVRRPLELVHLAALVLARAARLVLELLRHLLQTLVGRTDEK